MGWERRPGPTGAAYFYRSVKVGHTVKKVYLGRGAAGHEAAADIEFRRRDRSEARELLSADRDSADEADRLAAEVRAWAEVLLAASLVLSGYHEHRGQWRVRRANHGA